MRFDVTTEWISGRSGVLSVLIRPLGLAATFSASFRQWKGRVERAPVSCQFRYLFAPILSAPQLFTRQAWQSMPLRQRKRHNVIP